MNWRCSPDDADCGNCTCTCTGPYPCSWPIQVRVDYGPTRDVLCHEPDEEEETPAQRRDRLSKRSKRWKSLAQWKDEIPPQPPGPG